MEQTGLPFRQMDELLAHRWTARDRDLNERVLAVQAEMNRRGILASTISVKTHHDVFREEFQASKVTIVTTVVDCLRSRLAKLNRTALQTWGLTKLAERCDALDSLFRQRAKVSFQSLQNQAMITPFMDVAQYHHHESEEFSIGLHKALDDYESQLGATLTDRIVNRFKNYPVVAFGIIVVIVLAAIFGLFAAFEEITN
jgi:hypothetical protein